MGPRVPLLPAAAVAVLLLLLALWAFGPRQAPEQDAPAPRASAAAGLLKSRALPPLRPAGSGDLPDRVLPPPPQAEADATPSPKPGKRERFLARKLGRDLRRAAAAARRQQAAEVDGAVGEEPVSSGGPPRVPRPTVPPDSPYEGLSDDDLAELIVAMQRLRDSGALRRIEPQDYLRVMEIMPESRGLQDADRIFNDILGMGVGEWLARSRGGQTYILE